MSKKEASYGRHYTNTYTRSTNDNRSALNTRAGAAAEETRLRDLRHYNPGYLTDPNVSLLMLFLCRDESGRSEGPTRHDYQAVDRLR